MCFFVEKALGTECVRHSFYICGGREFIDKELFINCGEVTSNEFSF